jgi:hypothetical protein
MAVIADMTALATELRKSLPGAHTLSTIDGRKTIPGREQPTWNQRICAGIRDLCCNSSQGATINVRSKVEFTGTIKI